MKPLIVLLTAVVTAFITITIVNGAYNFSLAGRIAMSVMLLFTSIAHFASTTGMMLMVPAFLPCKKTLVYGTGTIEIFAATGLQLPLYSVFTGWMLLVFFILLLPANIYAAGRHVDYQKASFNGSGPAYLWFRVPLQLFSLPGYISPPSFT